MALHRISDHPAWNLALNILLDDSISEIESNGPDQFYAKKSGKRMHIAAIDLENDEAYAESVVTGLVPHIVTFIPFDPLGYIFEGPIRYEAGGRSIRGRCHIVLPPAADTPQVTIAKKSTSLATLDAIAGKGSMASEMLEFVKATAAADLTTVLSGGTGAGKTTFLEAFSKELSMETRIGVAEDTPELSLIQPNTSYLHSVPWRPGMDEKDVASLSWVVAQFNRMRTDKVIIGETRGKEFADFLIAANSGMEGSLTTIHADDPIRALLKMTNFALKGNPGQPIRSINTDIATSVDLVIQLAYFKSDSRYRVTAIQEITSTISNNESATITTSRLYTYNTDNDTWTKESNPSDALRKKFALHGVDISNIMKTPPGTVLQPNGRGADGSASGLPVRRI
jgi:pilus assembly protein CpaF